MNNESVKSAMDDLTMQLVDAIRTPIEDIRGIIDNSKANKTAESMANTLELVDQKTKTLENLVNDMLLLTGIEDDIVPMDMDTVSANSLLEEYFYDIIADSRFNSFDMKLDVPPLDCSVVIDSAKFTRVLDNIFSNAAQYAANVSNPSITLSARKVTSMVTTGGVDARKNGKIEYRSCLEISIADTGNGIPKEETKNIFAKAYKVKKKDAPNNNNGLGLTVAKAIIERFNGSITCKSEEGKGTIFIIVIPCE